MSVVAGDTTWTLELMVFLRTPQDQYRAVCIGDAMLADGADQHAGKLAVAPTPDHK